MALRAEAARKLRLSGVAATLVGVAAFAVSGFGLGTVGYRTETWVWYRAWVRGGTLTVERDPSGMEPYPRWICGWTTFSRFSLEVPWRPVHTKRVIVLDPTTSAVAQGVRIPLWLLPAVGVGLTLHGHALVRLGRARETGRCGACRYDVRGLTGNVCPECGNPIRSWGLENC